jgi:RNA polymerase sigma-70 factor (ECF subfamily)
LNPSPSTFVNPSQKSDSEGMQHFKRLALPHLDAAYNLARWLTNDDHDAENVVVEAYLRAQRCFAGCRGDDVRAWLLRIVSQASHSWLKEGHAAPNLLNDVEGLRLFCALPSDEPPAGAAGKADKGQINAAIAALPVALREVLVLRELEDLTYLEIARVVDVPVRTVMSRLSRARGLMRETLDRPSRAGQPDALAHDMA